jgi:hypothetical protein
MPQILRHWTHGFTSLPKEGVLRIFPSLKIRWLRPGLNPRTWVPEASTLTPRPPKPLWPCHLVNKCSMINALPCNLCAQSLTQLLHVSALLSCPLQGASHKQCTNDVHCNFRQHSLPNDVECQNSVSFRFSLAIK